MTRSLLIFGAIFVFAASAEPIPTCDTGPQCPGKNEVYGCKITSCKEDLCEKLTSKFRCNETEACTPGCYCESGYFRETRLDPCKNSCSCNNMKYAPSCVKTTCSGEIQCSGKNEEYGCKKASCEKDLCESILARYRCTENETCTPGCYCKSGFLREEAGGFCNVICACNNIQNSSDCLKKKRRVVSSRVL